MFLPLTKSVSLTETLDCGAWLGLLSDKVALNDFQMLETCLMEIEYSLSLSLDGWCPKSGLWGKLVTWAKTSVWLSWLMSNFWFLRKTHDLSKNLSVIVLADVVVVDILVKLLVFHEEKPVETVKVNHWRFCWGWWRLGSCISRLLHWWWRDPAGRISC